MSLAATNIQGLAALWCQVTGLEECLWCRWPAHLLCTSASSFDDCWSLGSSDIAVEHLAPPRSLLWWRCLRDCATTLPAAHQPCWSVPWCLIKISAAAEMPLCMGNRCSGINWPLPTSIVHIPGSHSTRNVISSIPACGKSSFGWFHSTYLECP